MIDPKAVTTYAQYNEDLVLLALFHNVKKGFYVDVGANDPTLDSVTKIFYDRGWTGINIEPAKSIYLKLSKNRPNDINLHCGAGSESISLVFREYTDAVGHSTFDDGQKKQHGEANKHKDYEVEIKTLSDIFEENKVPRVNFLKIDVEGFEQEVIDGNDWTKYRPQVVCVEANHRKSDWQAKLLRNKYRLFIVDGLNEYYIVAESWSSLTKDFAERIVELDYHALKQHQYQSWEKDSVDLKNLHLLAGRQDGAIKKLEADVAYFSRLSLSGQPWPRRLKRALYGLTIDWIRNRNDKH